MGLTGFDAVSAAIIAKLQADMPAKLTALNSEYDDGLALAAPSAASYFDYVLDPFTLRCDWPAVFVLDDGDEEDAEQSNFETRVMHYGVIVDFILRGTDPADLTHRLRRFRRAAVEILTVRHALAPACTNCTYQRGGGAQFTDPASGDLLQDLAARFVVTTAEAMP